MSPVDSAAVKRYGSTRLGRSVRLFRLSPHSQKKNICTEITKCRKRRAKILAVTIWFSRVTSLHAASTYRYIGRSMHRHTDIYRPADDIDLLMYIDLSMEKYMNMSIYIDQSIHSDLSIYWFLDISTYRYIGILIKSTYRCVDLSIRRIGFSTHRYRIVCETIVLHCKCNHKENQVCIIAHFNLGSGFCCRYRISRDLICCMQPLVTLYETVVEVSSGITIKGVRRLAHFLPALWFCTIQTLKSVTGKFPGRYAWIFW